MMTIPGCVDALKIAAAELPAASFLFKFARGFNTRLRIRLNPTAEAGCLRQPPIHVDAGPCPNTLFDFSLDLDTRLW
jgi:hypothetical protein